MISAVKHILVPTDFSNCSKNALNHALKIADETGSRITLLHAIEPPFNFPTNVDGVIEYLQENAEQHLERFSDHAEELYPNRKFKVKTQLRIGKPFSQILEAINDLKADLVVMGSGTDKSSRNMLYGSVSTDIVMRSPKPVLAVPEHVKTTDFSNILFTTNFRSNDFRNLEITAEFAKLFKSEIHVVHVTPEIDLDTDIKFRGMKELALEKKVYSPIRFSLIRNEDAFDGISEITRNNPVSIIVMNRYKKSVVNLLLDKNHAKKLSTYTVVPLLVLMGDK